MTDSVRVAELSIATGRYPFFDELREQPDVPAGPRLRFIEEYKPINRAFRHMVRELAFDIGELALATYVQARARGVPLTLLPVTVMCRFQHRLLVCDSCQRPVSPHDLEGKRVGVRAYSQTTGVWIRSLLRTQYGVDSRRIAWIVYEEPHVTGFREPDNVIMGDPGAVPLEQLRRGEIDAFVGEVSGDDCVTPVIPNPVRAAREWYETNGFVPVNHVLTVRSSLVETHARDIERVYGALRDAVLRWKKDHEAGGEFPGVDFHPLGFDALSPALEAMAEEAALQSLVPAKLALDDLVHPFSRELM